MRIEIEIPVEFEEHFNHDKFEDTLHRLSADAHLIAGRYEQETAIMLIKAFANSKPAYDVEKVVEELESAENYYYDDKLDAEGDSMLFKSIEQKVAIDIVRKGCIG